MADHKHEREHKRGLALEQWQRRIAQGRAVEAAEKQEQLATSPKDEDKKKDEAKERGGREL